MIRRTLAPVTAVAVKLVVSSIVLWSGFRAISDDDFARVTIAQQFASHPQLDPSGTSWLPMPFWVYGGVMALFGPSLTTARAVALLLGGAGTLGIWLSARWLGASPRSAACGAAVAALFPHSAYYGAAMVPDFPTAVLSLMAATSLVQDRGRIRVVGALLIAAGSLCRYETWPVAFVVAAFGAYDACRRSHHRGWMLGAFFIAPAGAIAWVAHGAAHHGDPLFFVKRVAAYRQALGEHALPLGNRLLDQPISVFTAEPELCVFALGLLASARLALGPDARLGLFGARPAIAVLALVGFLVLGNVLDGAPTHHAERTLLVVWLCLSVLSGTLLDRLGERALSVEDPKAARARLAVTFALCLAAGAGWLLRPNITTKETFVDRSRELAIGQVARGRVPSGERIAMYTEDFGYFAIQAAFARPGDATALLRRDPRRREADPIADAEAMASRLAALGTRYLVLPSSHWPALTKLGTLRAEAAGFSVVERH